MSGKKNVLNDGIKKKNEVRTSITVVVLGDENVGKSSLISTFVSRHFSEMVPGIMTRVRLPPDPSTTFHIGKGGEKKGGGCITTIVDTQGGDSSPLSSSLSSNRLNSFDSEKNIMNLKTSLSSSGNRAGNIGGISIDNVDVIVLVYDLDRIETFYRLENHWLPLIEQCYNGEIPVIVAGNKMDLRLSNAPDEQSQARSRHQIVTVLQRFKFVRQCIKCSAKTLLNVNDVFVKAQHAVLYPINTLYDLTQGKLTHDCQSAFTRIFRMFDQDNDGLLSNSELNNFQTYCFKVSLMEGDLAGWKKVLSKNNPSEAVVRDSKFTVFGFLAIFDVFISSDRLEIPWIILRTFGYDNDIRLEIPSCFASNSSSWKLSSSSLQFLTALFHQFSSKSDGFLSPEDILTIFSIIPNPSVPAWHPSRVEQFLSGTFSIPKLVAYNVPSAASKPTTAEVNERGANQKPPPDPYLVPMSLPDWIGHWHMLSSMSPSSTRAELYRLGYVEDSPHDGILRKKKSKPPPSSFISSSIPSNSIRAMVIGSQGCGKTAFLSALCHRDSLHNGKESPNYLETTPTLTPETSCMHVRYEDKHVTGPKSAGGQHGNRSKKSQKPKQNMMELLFTEIPEFERGGRVQSQLSSFLSESNNSRQGFDMVIFVFDCTDESSLSYVMDMERRMLIDETPRVFVGSKHETYKTNNDDDASKDTETIEKIKEISFRHCEELDLEPPILISASVNSVGGTGSVSSDLRTKTLEHLVRSALDTSDPNRVRARPHSERKRREAEERKKLLWLGGLMSASVAIVIGVGMFWKQKDHRSGRFGWLKSLFFLGGNINKTETKISSKES